MRALRLLSYAVCSVQSDAGSVMAYPEWKQFERLVARIEATLVPQGAVVRSPDRIPDLYTGSLREVDGSIRFNVGSASILITLAGC